MWRTHFFFPVLTDLLIKSHVTTLGRLIHITGSELSNTKAMAEKLGLKSIRVITQLLTKWKESITEKEFEMIKDFAERRIQPEDDDCFPNVCLIPDLEMCNGFLLRCSNLVLSGKGKVSGKVMYRCCVKVFNKKSLDGKIDTPWCNVLHLSENVRPEWGALYKSPLSKKTGDLQWRVLHGIIVECFCFNN